VNLRNRIKLIPRNHWDYGAGAYITALSNLNPHNSQTANLETIFHQSPLWTNTGRSSLFAILKALGLPQGAKVGVPLFCCSVVFNAIRQAGLTPCFIDSNLNDCNISAENLQKKRSGLAAVVAVHLFGNPCDLDAILDTAGSLPVIEDCAQSLFSTYKGKLTGLLTTASFFSFRCGKYISAGEGSAIFCQETKLREKLEQIVASFESWSTREMFTHALATYAKASLYNRPCYGLIGYPVGMRLDQKFNLTAKGGFKAGKIASTHKALVEKRIPDFHSKIDRQRAHAQLLLKNLVPVNYDLLYQTEVGTSNWFQFPLRFHNQQQRNRMTGFLFDQGIDAARYLNDIVVEARSQYGYTGDCPNAERLSKTILLIPIHYSLPTSDIEYIVRSINQASQII
jgi:dTDP-4-amino-4,6-dideoxygalactose transaminase